MNTLIRGYDYRRDVGLALTAAQWRSLLSAAAYTRRIGTSVLAFERHNGATSLAYEVYDDGAMASQRREHRT